MEGGVITRSVFTVNTILEKISLINAVLSDRDSIQNIKGDKK